MIEDTKPPIQIFVCTGSKCSRNKSEKLCDHLKHLVKEEGLKRSVRVVETECMDHCGEGPNVAIGDRLFHEVRPKHADKIVEIAKEKL